MKSYYKEIYLTETHIKFIVHVIFIVIIFTSSFKILYDPFHHRSSLYYILFNGRHRLRTSGEVFVVTLAVLALWRVIGRYHLPRRYNITCFFLNLICHQLFDL